MKKITTEEVNAYITKHFPQMVNMGETDVQMTGVPANSIILYKDTKANSVLLRRSIAVRSGEKQTVTWTRDFVIENRFETKMTYMSLIKETKAIPTPKKSIPIQGSLF
jgi:hypothetical protein